MSMEIEDHEIHEYENTKSWELWNPQRKSMKPWVWKQGCLKNPWAMCNLLEGHICSAVLCWLSGNLKLTRHIVQIWIWKRIFLCMKWWIWKSNGHVFMKSQLKCPWTHEYEKAFSWNNEYENQFSMKLWIWNREYHDIVNMKKKKSVKPWIWKGIWWNVSCEI